MWKEPEIFNFKVTYDGDAIQNNEIEAKILAESLLGISSAIEESNKIINGDDSRVFTKVRSNFKSGSFEVDLVQFLTSNNFQAAVNLITVLGFVGLGSKGLIQFIKFSKGKKITKKTKIDNNHSEVYIENCQSPTIVENQVINCYENKSIQTAITKTISPLYYKGVDSIGFSSNDKDPELITKVDLDSFKPLNHEECDEIEGEILDEEINEAFFVVAQSNLDGWEKGWKLSLSGESFSFLVTVSDKNFLKAVNSGKYSFSHGTIIHAKYRKLTKRKLKIWNDWEILEVLKLYPPDGSIPKIVRKNQKLFEE